MAKKKAKKSDYLLEHRGDGPVSHEKSCTYVTSSMMSCTCGGVGRWVDALVDNRST